VSNHYYATYNRPNVSLVTDPIERITAAGVVTADGTEHALDTLVLATGFQTTRFLAAIEVTGRGGVRLAEAWAEGAHAYKGITTAGFPNLFMLYGPNTNNGSIWYLLEAQADYAVRQVRRMDAEGIVAIDVRPEVEAAYNATLDAAIAGIEVWSPDRCHSYYRSPSGRVVTQWPHSMSEYRRLTEEPDAAAFVAVPVGGGAAVEV
jgi:hypothetical protein